MNLNTTLSRVDNTDNISTTELIYETDINMEGTMTDFRKIRGYLVKESVTKIKHSIFDT